MGSDYDNRVAGRLACVREAIARAAERVGRDPDDVRVIAVTKGHSVTAVEAAAAAGLRDVGENRVEELEVKVAAVGSRLEGVRWHMIGPLQRRKVPRILGICDLLHSVGTAALAERVSSRWTALDPARPPGDERGFPVLLQVNTSGEDAKGGFTFERAEDELREVLELPGLRAEGLMTMAPFTDDESVLRMTFRRLRELREAVGGAALGPELSMGMTNDYMIAVEEGSTMVRLGTALFGERPT